MKNLKRKYWIELCICFLLLLLGCRQGKQQSDSVMMDSSESLPVNTVQSEQGVENEQQRIVDLSEPLSVDTDPSAQVEQHNEPIVIDLSMTIPMNTVQASTMIEDIRYIPLETTDESVIGPSLSLIPVQDGFFIWERISRKICYFGADGKFIRHIASRGQGPGEYSSLYGFDVSEKDELIYLYSSNRQILVYTFDNKFVRSIRLDENTWFPSIKKTSWGFLIDKNHIWQTQNYGKETPALIALDEDGNELNVLQYRIVEVQQSPLNLHSAIFKEYDGKYYYYPPFQDTIYSVQVDKIVPEFILPKGRYNIAMKDIETIDKYREATARGLMLDDFIINNRWLMLYCRRQYKQEMYLFDFASNKLVGVTEIVNDVDNSFNITWVPWVIYQNQWVMLNQAFNILKEEKELPAALKNLDQEDNPVVRISKLKP